MPVKNKIKKFSEKKYYKLVSLFLFFPVWWAIASHSFWPLVYFAVFGIFGMLGEILFSEWWLAFYKQPFYKYSVQGIVHSYSAKINFIPWGAGGLFCLWVIDFFNIAFPGYGISLKGLSGQPFYYIFILCFFAGIALQFLVRIILEYIHPRGYKFKQIGIFNQSLFFLPFFAALAACGMLFTAGFFLLAVLIGIFCTLIEYLYGKILQYFFGRKFWIYKPLSFDGGHFTPLTIVPFAMLGFYFWGIYGVIKFLFKITANV